jgi:hypothetical protein
MKGRIKEGTVSLVNMVEPGHELTATPPDSDGLCTTLCECGWASSPGIDAQPYLEARDHILSVRGGRPGSIAPQGLAVRVWQSRPARPWRSAGGPVAAHGEASNQEDPPW